MVKTKSSTEDFKEAVKQFDLLWDEFLKDRPMPKTEKEMQKQLEEFYEFLKKKNPDSGFHYAEDKKPKKKGKELRLEQIDEHEWQVEFPRMMNHMSGL